MSIVESALDILDKFIPGRMEAYAEELNSLLVQYDKALTEGRNTDAAMIRKRMVVLRRKLGLPQKGVE